MTKPSPHDRGGQPCRATTCCAVLLAATVAAFFAPGVLRAQSTEPDTPSWLSLTAGPAALRSSYRSARGSTYADWYWGASVGAKVTLSHTDRLGSMIHVSALRAPDGANVEWATAGFELRLGRSRQIPLSLAAGVMREPGGTVCHMTCSPISRDVAATAAASIGYLVRTGKLDLGPEFTWTRGFGEGTRYHSLNLGLRVATR
ncbi:MAG: hypothetical protein KF785_14650, partial [Gemmatimonadales bacterium]|nr:hypothetical protein [Gemmatimonadales bacterium]